MCLNNPLSTSLKENLDFAVVFVNFFHSKTHYLFEWQRPKRKKKRSGFNEEKRSRME